MNSFWTSFQELPVWDATVQTRFVFVERITNQPMTFGDNALPNSHNSFLKHDGWKITLLVWRKHLAQWVWRVLSLELASNAICLILSTFMRLIQGNQSLCSDLEQDDHQTLCLIDLNRHYIGWMKLFGSSGKTFFGTFWVVQDCIYQESYYQCHITSVTIVSPSCHRSAANRVACLLWGIFYDADKYGSLDTWNPGPPVAGSFWGKKGGYLHQNGGTYRLCT